MAAIIHMEFGYMPSSGEDIFKELKFARRHFDFIEVTYYPGIDSKAFKKSLEGFKALGHCHWELDTSSMDSLEEAVKQVRFFQGLGAEKVTIHPTGNSVRDCLAFLKALGKATGATLLAENTAHGPFHNEGVLRLARQAAGLTLDTGHALLKGSLDSLMNSGLARHMHLHGVRGKRDHVPIDASLLGRLGGYSGTATLEIFYSGEGKSLEPEERKLILLEQLELAKGYKESRPGAPRMPR